jgi:hypothetical protein
MDPADKFQSAYLRYIARNQRQINRFAADNIQALAIITGKPDVYRWRIKPVEKRPGPISRVVGHQYSDTPVCLSHRFHYHIPA